jgi:O-antigen/teichoic acid export membrane protein
MDGTRLAVRSRRRDPRPDGGGDLRRVVPIVAAGALAGVASLVTTVVVARLLSSRNYGAFIVLLGLFLVLSMPGSALLVAVVRRIAAWESEGGEERVHPWVVRVHVVGTVAVVLLALIIWLARGPLISALSLPGSGAVVAIVSAAGIWVLVCIDRGLLQARRDYRDLSVNLVVEALGRTAATVGLAAVWGVTGAALGVLLGELATAVHARVTALAALSRGPAVAEVVGAAGTRGDPAPAASADGREATAHSGRDLAADLVTALVSLFMLAVLQNADVIGLGSAAPRRSGSYAAISVPSKALVYAALVFVNYLLPESAIRWHRGSHALRQLGHTLLVLGLPALVLLGVATGAPHTLLEIVFGAKLTGAAPAFSTLVLAMVFLCLTVVLTVYLLGVGWRPVVFLLTAGSGALILATLAAHGRFVATARADLIVQAVLALSLGIALVGVHKKAGRRLDRDTVGPADQGDS